MQYQYMRLMNGAGYPVWKNIRLGVAIPLVVFLLIGSNEVVAGWELFNRDASTMTNPVRTVQAVPSGQPGIMETRSSTGTTVTTNETKATPEIQSLAAGLEYDPKLIFEYVSNHIEFRNPSFGIANGAAGCLLNEMGNDWDQAALLSSLLRVSGYSTRFVLGKVEYTKIDLANWFGVDTNQVAEMLADNGNEAFIGADPSLMGMYRMWTEVSIDGNWYVFDPAFREYTYVEGLDLTNITGYSRSDFLSYATNGATITEDYVQYLDGDAIDAALLCYSTNLMACIRSEYPSAVMSEIIGGRKQNSVVCESFPTNLPKATYSEAVEVWDHIPATNCASLDLEMFENEYTLMGYDIAGKRVSFTCPDFAFDMYIWLDGELWTVITNEDLSSYPLLTVEIKRPYYPENHYMSSFQMHVFGSYVLVHEFDGTAGDCTEKIAEQLARDVEAGYAEESEPVLCGALHLAAVNGLQQAYLSRQLLSKLGNVAGYSKHIIGVIGEESHLYPDEQRGGGFIMQRHGYFVDLQNCIFAVTPKDGEIEDALAWTRSAMFMLSGLEHVMLEQSQGVEHEAVSTIKLLHLNNELGNRTYYADTNNWNLVQQGVTNYDEFKVAEIDAYIAYGYVYLLPQDAQMTAAGWDRSCMGYTYYYNLETNFALAMLISGDYTNFYGGQSVESHYPFGPVQLDQYQNLSPANWPKVESEEPVDLYTGHYMLENTDLTVGGGTPQGLQLTRSYNSGLATTMGPLGYGWTHGYGAKILEGHQSAPLFGTRKPIDATAMIAEGMVLLDLLRCHPDLTRWPTAYIVAKWGMDQLLGCSASLRIDADSLEFVRLADGSYAGPADLNATLTKSNGLFTLQERMGNTMLFNTNGQLAARIDIDGNAVNYHYDGDGLLTELTNTFGRKLTFTYTNNLVSSVNDSCGRTIIYQYSTNGNLVSYTDPEGNAWTYEYDSEGHHRIAVLRDPLNQITASNTYGSAGRVVSQKNGLGETWNFYYTGQSSIEEDPLGGQMTYDFNDQGQLTGAEDALSNRADAVYNSDGLLVQETDARGFVT
ncbi:MAG: hypothetical protein EOM20_11680, partial [Spartobacteria bacterium]|nr:hypothetical protein [Spartobacteria bacterium]